MSLGIAYDDAFLDHTCTGFHPERPERLLAAVAALRSAGLWDDARLFPSRLATRQELLRVHDERYLGHVADALKQSSGFLDADTFFSPGSERAAWGAAGAAIDLADAVQERQVSRGIALLRPPGHHATRTRAMGFCLLNNIALAAAQLLARSDVGRVAIFDWDVHHGNGTEDAFWDDPRLLFVSFHQSPHYPGTGRMDDLGGTSARGTTVNLPFPAGARDRHYLAAFERVVAPLFAAFRPQHILISAGFDAHERDPLGGMRISTEGFGALAAASARLADRLCGGRLTLFLEGGYDLAALGASVVAVTRGVLDPGGFPWPDPVPFQPAEDTHDTCIARLLEILPR